MNIGQVASRAGIAPATVRYYERLGLIPRPPRTNGGYRQYEKDAVDRLRFIKKAQRIGFSLEDIHELLELHRHDAGACSEVQTRAAQKIRVIRERIDELATMEQLLEKLVATCQASLGSRDCALFAALVEGESLR